MPTANYTLFPLAKSDLEDIWLYTRDTWSSKQADIYLQSIFATFDKICQGSAHVTDVSDIRVGYFRVSVGSHYVFFKLADNRPQIVRILHQRMNVETWL